MKEILAPIMQWFSNYWLNLLLSLVIVAVYLFVRKLVIPRLEAYVDRDHLKNSTIKSAIFTFSLLTGVVTAVIVMMIWGFDFRGLLALSTGIIAVTGVALFASWSILSNVTAFFILLAHQSFRRGNYIRVIEMDNYLEGYINEINLFNTILITENKEIVVYPNNLLTARPIIVNPEVRYPSIGKTDIFQKDARLTDDSQER